MKPTLFALCALSAFAQSVPTIKEAISCPQTPDGRQPYAVKNLTTGDLRKITINSPNAVCNDGTPAVIFVRPARPGATEPDGPSANRWLIHFLGGSSCKDYEECATRWCGIGQWEGTLMTTNFEADFRNAGGLFNRNGANRIADRNLVLLKYCSSDQWQGRKSNVVLRSETDPAKAYSLHFQGANIVSAIFDTLERGVPGLPKLTDATDVLLSGDSACANGARAHSDRLAARLRAANPNVRVRASFEATFDPDLNGKQGFPAGDPRDPVYASKTEKYNEVHVGLRNAHLDDSCLAAHPTAAYLCAEAGYLTLNHITTPFFQAMDIQDQLLINGYQEGGSIATDAQFGQLLADQLNLLPNIRNTAIDRANISTVPGVAGRNCGIHVTWSDDDRFFAKWYRTGPNAPAYSYYELLWNWLTGATPSTVIAPKPPLEPAIPARDAACNNRATALPSVVTLSSASYAIGGPVAPESIVATFGANLATVTAVATTTPWPSTLGGLQVSVTDAKNVTRPAPLYYVSPTQLSFLIPTGTATGTAQITIGAQKSTVEIAATAPYLKISRTGARTEGLLFDATTKAAAPIPVAPTDQVYLILYGTGLRGGPATATVGEVAVPVAGPVAQGQYQGLDQINLGPLPLRIGYGTKEIVIRQGEEVSNFTTVTFRQP